MEIELLEIRDFLAEQAPFNALPAEVLDQLPRSLAIRYARRGSPFPPADADGDYLYILRSGAIEFRDPAGLLCDKLDEGEFYSAGCGLMELPADWQGIASEDTLLYLLDCDRLAQLRSNTPEFDRHFSRSLHERLRQAIGFMHNKYTRNLSDMTGRVSGLIKRAPVTIEKDRSIRDAARIMTEEHISSIMVTDNGALAGLITDSSLRKRCIVEGISPEEPVGRIMRTRLVTINHDAGVFEALTTMSRLQVYHLPVLDQGRLIGIVTSSDLARQQSTNTAFIASDIRKAATLDDLVRASEQLPELQVQLAGASATASHIGDAVSSITDLITIRLIELAEQELGPAPAPWVWVAGGSQARREQTSHSDQDNAIIIADEADAEHAPWFEKLATYVCDGLNACGYVYCPGNAMASNPQWRVSLSQWRQYFDTWIRRPEPKALMLSCIFFDLRAVHGDTQLLQTLKQDILRNTRDNGLFTAYMAANALTHRPPIGFFRKFVLVHDGEHDDTLDIKHRGVIPITDLARVFALHEGLDAVGTIERLRAVAGTPSLSTEMAESLVAAWEFIAGLRIQHQARQIRSGIPADNYLAPSEISSLERQQLKDAFSIIKDMQDTLDNRYQLARFR